MDRPRSPDLAFRLFGAKPEHRLALLRAAWPSAVGEDLARRTRLVALDGAVLRVMVKDAGWQRSLLRMRGDILARLRQVAGRAAPHALGFVTGEVATPEPAAPPPPAAPAAPPPPAVADAARAIPDPELRAAFERAAGRYLARFGAAQAGRAGAPASGRGGGATGSS